MELPLVDDNSDKVTTKIITTTTTITTISTTNSVRKLPVRNLSNRKSRVVSKIQKPNAKQLVPIKRLRRSEATIQYNSWTPYTTDQLLNHLRLSEIKDSSNEPDVSYNDKKFIFIKNTNRNRRSAASQVCIFLKLN